MASRKFLIAFLDWMEGKATAARQSSDPLQSDALATVRALHEIAFGVVLDPGAVFCLAPDVMGQERLAIEDLTAARAFHPDNVASVHVGSFGHDRRIPEGRSN
jgi:hypothetical protein